MQSTERQAPKQWLSRSWTVAEQRTSRALYYSPQCCDERIHFGWSDQVGTVCKQEFHENVATNVYIAYKKKSEHGMWGAWIEHVWRSKQEQNEQLCVSDRSDRRRWQKRQIYESIELFGQLLHSIDCHGKCRQLTWSVHQWRHNLKLRNQIYCSLSNIYWDSWIYIQIQLPKITCSTICSKFMRERWYILVSASDSTQSLSRLYPGTSI